MQTVLLKLRAKPMSAADLRSKSVKYGADTTESSRNIEPISSDHKVICERLLAQTSFFSRSLTFSFSPIVKSISVMPRLASVSKLSTGSTPIKCKKKPANR